MATDLRPSTRESSLRRRAGNAKLAAVIVAGSHCDHGRSIVRRTARGTRVECRKSWLTRRRRER